MEKKVLFLCSQNAARSQMAEAILNIKGRGRFAAYSAGLNPASQIDSFAIEAMKQDDIDISCKVPKSLKEFENVKFDFIITLCDKAINECPSYSSDTITAHWGITDPINFKGADEEKIKFYIKVKKEIMTRINVFLSLPIEKLDKLTLETKLQESEALLKLSQ
ncbi:arsenate reductase ArsC [Clostridium chromiireducens]|uniref:Arsenate reductase ArsC n=1 Tax=Clostridium chromiireducens TaxID=225345 RepID=A0A964RR56_9CLOT|nr:arsenate reductase ArsC [Clostridium chromiireducens]MVX66331.1 arsenate reductase ArsC [Clostridium chromiireducens]